METFDSFFFVGGQINRNWAIMPDIMIMEHCADFRRLLLLISEDTLKPA